MNKVLKVQVCKTFYADVFIVVPDGFSGNVSKYSNAIRQQADSISPRQVDMHPWKEDRECFEFDEQVVAASEQEIETLLLNDMPEDKPDY